MRIAGILCEYNPLHMGHLMQIKAVREKTDFLVCLMSASFVQRGEPAIYDKFTRAKWALAAGADAVFELPCLYSLQSAEGFAEGAMRVFGIIGIDTLYFGSECNMETLQALAEAYDDRSPRFSQEFRLALDAGLSYAAAREKAALDSLPNLPKEAFMRNAVLGTEYLLALKRLHLPIQAVALPREGNLSASHIRSLLYELEPLQVDHIKNQLPSFVLEELPHVLPVRPAALSDILLYKLRSMPKEAFVSLPDISEGLENRLYNAAQSATDYEDLLLKIAHRRMPLSRMKRVLMCALLGVDRTLQQFYQEHGPTYLRLLGLRKDASSLISVLKDYSPIPIITQPVHHQKDPMLQKEILATDIHALLSQQPAGLDFTKKFTAI